MTNRNFICLLRVIVVHQLELISYVMMNNTPESAAVIENTVTEIEGIRRFKGQYSIEYMLKLGNIVVQMMDYDRFFFNSSFQFVVAYNF